jgi:hypothetical protein
MRRCVLTAWRYGDKFLRSFAERKDRNWSKRRWKFSPRRSPAEPAWACFGTRFRPICSTRPNGVVAQSDGDGFAGVAKLAP